MMIHSTIAWTESLEEHLVVMGADMAPARGECEDVVAPLVDERAAHSEAAVLQRLLQ